MPDYSDLRPHDRPDVRVPVPPVELDAELRARLRECSACILGVGGLGSNIAAMLLRSGLLTMTLVDFDRVDLGNLNRQLFFRDQVGMLKTEALAATLTRIDPDVRLTLVNDTLTAENVADISSGADVVIEAVDRADTKAMIINTVLRDLPDMPLVTASGLAGYGSANAIVTERFADRLFVVGDLTSDVREGHPLFASRVMVAAAHQAHAVIRLLLGFPDP